MSSNASATTPATSGPALRGDLTQGPVAKTLLLFSLPALAANVLQTLSGTINAIWVGRLIGEEALAATANANVVMFLVTALAFGFGMAGTVLIGQRWGARDVAGARRAFGSLAGFSALFMSAIALAGHQAAPMVLRLLATPGEVYPLALTYLEIIFLSMPFMMVSIVLTMGLRGIGDATTPLIFIGLSVVLDILFNPLLIAGPGPLPALGIAGSALATMLASCISFVAMVIYVYARDLPLRLRGRELAFLWPARRDLAYVVGKGLPMGAQMLLMSAAGLIMVGLVNREGLTVVAGYAAIMQLFNYIQMPALATGAAVSAMAAQYIGAGRWGSLDAVTRAGVRINLVLTGAVALLLLAFDRPVLALFLGADSPAIAVARHIQLLASWSFVLFAVTMVYTATMRSAGAVWAGLLVIAVSLYPVRLGFYHLAYPLIGADALWLSFPVGGLAGLAIGWLLYHRWDWRTAAGAPPAGRATAEPPAA